MCDVRFWSQRSLLAVLMTLAATSAIVGATTARGEPRHLEYVSPSGTRAGALRAVPTSAPARLPPQGGYRGIENFCSSAPLTGHIHYDGSSGGLIGVLTVSVAGLPPNDQVFVNWTNDSFRAPVIASFATDSVGVAIQSSVDVGRLGEVRGVGIVLSAAGVPNPALGHLEPC